MSEKEFLSQLREHQRIIYRLVHFYASTEEDKKDLYQEILLQAWRAYPSFRGDSKFSTWLYSVAVKTIFTVQKKTSRIVYTDTAQYKERLSVNDRGDDVDQLYEAIRTLGEIERAIVTLHLDGFSNQEIAAMLGISANHAGVKLHRAKQELAKLLKNDQWT